MNIYNCPTHIHSEYSQIDGVSTVNEIANRCLELGYPAVGLSDHGTVAGHLAFAKTMKKKGIKPIFCMEGYHGIVENPKARDQAHVLVGAMTDEGLRNLWRLSDAAASNFYHVPRMTWEMMEKYSEGVFATTACMMGLCAQGVMNDDLSALNHYLEIFKDRFFIELHTYPGEDHERLNLEYVQIAEEKGIPLKVEDDAHFAFPEQYEVHDAYTAMKMRETVYLKPEERKMWHPKTLYIRSVDQIRESLDYLPSDVVDEALLNSVELAAKVNADLPEVKRHLPLFIPKECPWLEDDQKEHTAAHLFVDLVERGLIWRYGEDADEEVWQRAEKEMSVFLNADLEHYFLQAWDFCQFCDSKDIRRGPGRGSAGGTIVAYALGITDIDPIFYELSFERFYNPGRAKGLPDIDNDFPTTKRMAVRKYMLSRWGDKRVRTIGTITRMKPKAACDATHLALGVTYQETNDLKAIISNVPDIEIHGPDSIGWDEEVDPGKTIYVAEHVGEDIDKWVHAAPLDRQPVLERWINLLRHVCSRVANYGVHPSGTVVSDVDLDVELPCRWSPQQKMLVTQFPMSDVESREFLKQDYLGLRNLDTIEKWEELHGKMDWSGMDKQEWPEDMWAFLDKGFTAGVFQIEDGYARQLCKEIRPRSIGDLAAIVAMNRPGPIRAGVPDSYIARRNGEIDDKFDGRTIELLKDILEPTYGHFLYQEQVIAYMGAIGYSPSDADAVRKILGKKKPEEMRDLGRGEGEWKGKGYKQMAKSAGLDDDIAMEIWHQIEEFASYSFNKSHAACYAIMSFRTTYPLYYGLQEWIISLIDTNPEDAPRYVSMARRLGIRVKAPEIDRSDVNISVQDGDILFGFSNIKDIGKGTAEYICKLREKYDITAPEKMYEAIEAEWKQWDNTPEDERAAKSPRQEFRANLYEPLFDAGCWDAFEFRNLTLDQRQKYEKDLLGVILSDNTEEVFAHHSPEIDECDAYIDFLDEEGPAKVSLPGSSAERRGEEDQEGQQEDGHCHH
jgi:DNA polymerase-3 subunit alpha